MPKIIKGENGLVSVRLDGAYVTGGKHLVEAYIDDEENKRFFGNFKFTNPKVAKQLLKEAVKQSDFNDTVFEGQYPKWVEDNYGESLQVQNRVKFYKSIKSDELIDNDKIENYIYALEVHLKKSKDDGIFLVVARAIATSKNTNVYQDELFDDITDRDPDVDKELATEEDLPF